MTALPRRMLRAALLRADTYEEIEADPRALAPACGIVLAACLAIGVSRYFVATAAGIAGGQLGVQVALRAIEPLVLWTAGSAFAFMVGGTFLRGPETETDFREVLRTTGFAFTPALLQGLACLPPPALGLGIDLVARLWMFVAVVVALRQALDFTTPRAVGTFGVSALLLWLLVWGLTAAPLPI